MILLAELLHQLRSSVGKTDLRYLRVYGLACVVVIVEAARFAYKAGNGSDRRRSL